MDNKTENSILKIWIVEDESSFREVLSYVLNRKEGMSCDRTFGSAETALTSITPENVPDVILVDLQLPGLNGADFIKSVKTNYPQIHLIVVTNSDDRPTVFNAICMGASGYLVKNDSFDKIVDSIQMVARGGSPLSGSIATMVLSVFQLGSEANAECKLTKRQTEILRLLSKGVAKKEIVDSLGIANHTVDFHLRKVYEKLQVNSQAGAVGKAIRKGLI